MLALIDADIVCYRIGFTTENEDLAIAQWRCDEMLDNILVDTGATEFKLFLSDNKENNFRFKLCSTYKANRTQPKPRWHEEIKEHLIVKWGAEFAYGMEADDALGIHQSDRDRTVICSIDKDLMQIPGLHYNFVKKEFKSVTFNEGLRYFYKQILIGDTSDNITGCRGIGPVKADKIVGTLDREIDVFKVVVSAYQKQHKDLSNEAILDHILLVGRLLKIKQSEEEPLWDFPQELQTTATQQFKSIPEKGEGNDPYMEPIGPATDGAGLCVNGTNLATKQNEVVKQEAISLS